jgi:hypothetical protein
MYFKIAHWNIYCSTLHHPHVRMVNIRKYMGKIVDAKLRKQYMPVPEI